MTFQPGRLMTTHTDNWYFPSTRPWPLSQSQWQVTCAPDRWKISSHSPIPNSQMSNFQCTQCSGHLALPQLSVQYTQSVLLAVHYPTSTPPYFPHSLDLIADDLERMVEAGVWSTGKIKALYPRRPGDDAASWKRHGGPLEKSRPSFASYNITHTQQRINHGTPPRIWPRSPAVRNADAVGPTISQRMPTLQLGHIRTCPTGGRTWTWLWNVSPAPICDIGSPPYLKRPLASLHSDLKTTKINKKYFPTASRVKPLAPPPFTLI